MSLPSSRRIINASSSRSGWRRESVLNRTRGSSQTWKPYTACKMARSTSQITRAGVQQDRAITLSLRAKMKAMSCQRALQTDALVICASWAISIKRIPRPTQWTRTYILKHLSTCSLKKTNCQLFARVKTLRSCRSTDYILMSSAIRTCIPERQATTRRNLIWTATNRPR